MRILHLDSGRTMRGGQWQALRLHQGLMAAGHESLLLARDGSPLLSHAETRPLRPLEIARLSRGFDLIHAHDARSHTLAAMLAGAPLVVSRRVAFPVGSLWSSRWKYGRAALFLAVSHYVAGKLREAGIAESRISVVYDGVPVPAEPAHGDALLVIDKETGLAPQTAALAGVELTPVSDLSADLLRSRGLVYLTNAEGLGSGVLLAMAHGVAVVASKTGGIPELIENGENGLLVANDAREVADAIGRIRSDTKGALGRAGRETVLARFTEKHMIDATLAAYARVLTRG